MSREGPGLNGHSERSAVSRRKTSSQLRSILSYPPKSCPALYFEVIYTSIAQFTGNKAIKLFTFGNLGGSLGFGECRKSHNSLITLYMYAIMSYNTILSCISKIGYPLQPHKRRSFNGKARPIVYKSLRKSPTFLKSATSEEAVSTDPSCVYLQGLQN